MEQDESKSVHEMWRRRLSLNSQLVWDSMLVVLSISLVNLLYQAWPSHARTLALSMVIVLAAAQFVLILIGGRDLRRWRDHLKTEREGILTMMRADLESKYPQDVVNETMEKIKEEWPNLL